MNPPPASQQLPCHVRINFDTVRVWQRWLLLSSHKVSKRQFPHPTGFSNFFLFFSNIVCILFIKHREKMACVGNRDALSRPTAVAKCITWAAPDCNRPQHMWANEETGRFKGRTFYFGIIKHPQVLQWRGGQNGENLDPTVSGALATSLIYGFSRYDGALRGSLL